jgi:hypothetical protein
VFCVVESMIFFRFGYVMTVYGNKLVFLVRIACLVPVAVLDDLCSFY